MEDSDKIEVDSNEQRKKIFILTNKGNIYRSSDNGLKWDNIT